MINNIKVLTIIIMAVGTESYSYTFKEAVEKIKEHQSFSILSDESNSLKEEAFEKGSWGDPQLKLAAKNFPKSSFKNNETPMTGVEIGIAQKIALSRKFSIMKEGHLALSELKEHEANLRYQDLVRNLWKILIKENQLKNEINILEENYNWINNILKVSKRLYSNGKATQQAILDIQIRKSDIEVMISSKEFELKEQFESLNYLLGLKGEKIQATSIPWSLLDRENLNVDDRKEESIKSKINAKKHILNAKRLSLIPDVTVSVGYTKRSNIDGRGDFVSAAVIIPLPVSSKKYAGRSKAYIEKSIAEKKLIDYRNLKESMSKKLSHQIDRVSFELNILQNKTLKFAETSRKVTAKSYSLGDASYIELLQSELKYQELLLKKIALKAQLLRKKVELKYLLGSNLHE